MSSDSVHRERAGSTGNSPLRRNTPNASTRKDSSGAQDPDKVKVIGRNKLPQQARLEAAVQRRKRREEEERAKREGGDLTEGDRRASGAPTPPQRSSSIHTPPHDDIIRGSPGDKPTFNRRYVKPSNSKDVLRKISTVDPSVKDEDSSYAMQNRPERDKDDEHMTAEEKFALGRKAASEVRAQMEKDYEPSNPYGPGIQRSSSPRPLNVNHSRTNSRATPDTHSGHGPSKTQEHNRSGSVSSASSVVKERRDSAASNKAPTIPAGTPRHVREDSLTGPSRRTPKFVELDDDEVEKRKKKNEYIPPPGTSVPLPRSSPLHADRASMSSASQSSTILKDSASTLGDDKRKKKARKLTGQADKGEEEGLKKQKKGKKDQNNAAR